MQCVCPCSRSYAFLCFDAGVTVISPSSVAHVGEVWVTVATTSCTAPACVVQYSINDTAFRQYDALAPVHIYTIGSVSVSARTAVNGVAATDTVSRTYEIIDAGGAPLFDSNLVAAIFLIPQHRRPRVA